MHTFLYFIIAAPFLLILPGLFLTKIFFSSLDRIEKSTLPVLLSMVVIYSGLFVTEKVFGKVTPQNTAFTVIVVNLVCCGLYIFVHFKKTKRL